MNFGSASFYLQLNKRKKKRRGFTFNQLFHFDYIRLLTKIKNKNFRKKNANAHWQGWRWVWWAFLLPCGFGIFHISMHSNNWDQMRQKYLQQICKRRREPCFFLKCKTKCFRISQKCKLVINFSSLSILAQLCLQNNLISVVVCNSLTKS